MKLLGFLIVGAGLLLPMRWHPVGYIVVYVGYMVGINGRRG